MASSTWDVEMFISEVKKYPELWNTTSDLYRYRGRKQRAWGEVAKVFVEDYDDLNATERNELFKKLINKWRNIKDSYVRHTKRKCNSKKGYLYATQLSFLDDVYKQSLSDDDEQRDDTWPSDDEGKLKKILFKSMFQKDESIWQNEDSSELAKKRKTDIEFVETSCSEGSYAVDEDKSFFDSLLPAVREFTMDQKLEFRTDLIKLIKAYRRNGRRSIGDSD